MFKDATLKHRNGNGNGVSVNAVTLAVFAVAVVVISFVILVNYLTGLADRQSWIEESVQASLTAESAVTALEIDFRNNSVPDLEDIPVYSTGNQHTVFRITGTSTIPPEELGWRSAGYSILSAIPAGNSIFVLSESENRLKVNLLSGEHFEYSEEVFSDEEWYGGPFCTAAAVCDDVPVLFLVRGIEGYQTVTVISHENTAVSYNLDIPVSCDSSVISAGSYSGNPVLLISDGSNSARMFIPGSLAHLTLSSVPGTTPVFYGQNRLFGDIGGYHAVSDRYPVEAIVFDDFDGDGTGDLVFAGPGSICFVSGAAEPAFLDTVPDGRLVAWGKTGEEPGLSARWIADNSQERWRTYTQNGFIYSSGPEFFPFDWIERIEYYRNAMLGTVNGSYVISDGNTGEFRTICDNGNAVLCQLDSGELDLVCFEYDSLRILMNPLAGQGIKLEMRSITYIEGNKLFEDRWDIMIFGTGSLRRVRSERTS